MMSLERSATLSRGTNQVGMREANERLILSLLRRQGNIAKADIARHTGLSAQTVARLIGAMEEDGLILRGKPQRGRVGQPSVPLSLNPKGAVFLGMKVGRRSVEMIAIDFMGAILDREIRLYEYPGFDDVFAFAQMAKDALVSRLPKQLRSRVAGLGIAMPFFLWNWADQIGVNRKRMEDWKHHDLQAELADVLDIPVFLQNDASAACSGELVFGDTALPAGALSIFIAFFVGGGLVMNHGLYVGTSGNAAGLGPLRVADQAGRVRPLIELASLYVLEKRLIAAGCDTRKMWIDGDEWNFPNDIVSDWIQQCAHALAQAVLAVQTILDLDTVLVEGWLPRPMLVALRSNIEAEIAKLDMSGIRPPAITAGTVGKDARSLGAASLPLSHRFLMG